MKTRIKAIALVLAGTFLIQELSYAAPVDSMYSHDSSYGSPLQMIAQNPTLFETPLDFADLKEIHRGTNGRLIIHIQDAHSNLSGQENLAKTLEAISEKYYAPYGRRLPVRQAGDASPLLVLSEGGEGDCTLTPIKKIASPEVWKRLGRSYLAQGKIQGEEYLNLSSNRSMKIMGVEDLNLYMESLKNYAALAGKREAILDYLKTIEVSVEKLKNKYYTKELLEYEKDRNQKSEIRNQGKSIEGLLKLAEEKNISLNEFPAIQQLINLKDKEKQIDFNLANLEQAALVEKTHSDDLIPRRASLARDDRTKKNFLFCHLQNTSE
ncbi:MAG: hypothetical protein HYZ52_00690 [Candidatus Omnitrophica bacterium]|nr:hypothetical protein [Candidatus Omnitrophota bacterium]